MTQSEIARQIGRSQPEVSRLLRFHGTSPLARNLRRNADQIRQLVADGGGDHVRVFGSVAMGEDQPDSDVDLLFDMTKPLSFMQLGRLERQIADLLDAPVDLVPESALRPDLRERVHAEAVTLWVGRRRSCCARQLIHFQSAQPYARNVDRHRSKTPCGHCY